MKIKGILNKKNGQIVVSPSKKCLKKFDDDFEGKIKQGKRMLWEWRGFE